MDTMVGLRPGQGLPEFSAETLDGRLLTESAFSERLTAFLFVAPDCGPCVEEMPAYVQLASLAQSRSPDLVLVSDGDAKETRAMVGPDTRATILVAPKQSNDLFRNFAVPGTPHFALFEKGRIITSGMPSARQHAWRSLLAMWNGGGRTVSTATSSSDAS